MLRFLLFSFLLFSFSLLTAQSVPQAFKYQSVIRDATGNTVVNQNIGVRFYLVQGPDNTVVYAETHLATSNQIGLVNLNIGRGTVESGDFSLVDWSQATSLGVGIDVTGGTNFVDFGEVELLSVPYAIYAGNGGGDDADADPTNEIQTLTQTGSEVSLSNGGGTVSVNDADADPTNEIELPTDAPVGSLAYSDGTNWVALPPGIPGAQLVIGEGGLPTWQGGFTSVTLSNGTEILLFPEVNVESIGWNPGGTNGGIPAIPGMTAHPSIAALNADLEGPSNTAAIVDFYGEGIYAAKFCQDLEAEGFSDWYLPSSGELVEINAALGISGSGQITTGQYYSSSRSTGTVAIWDFATEFYVTSPDNSPRSCRCVRRP